MATIEELESLRWDLRRDCVDIIMAGAGGHIGGDMSVIDALMTLYANHLNISPETVDDPNRDRFVLSKGHCAPGLYATLAERGFFPVEDLPTLRHSGSYLQGHPNMNTVPGVDMSTGSLGQGVSTACGMALGAKQMGSDINVYTLLGDGEVEEGECWEAFMFANHYKLDNLTVIVDNNGLQIDGSNDEVMSLGDMAAKLRAFGFDLYEIDGHDLDAVEQALSAPATTGKPKAILAHTVKGKGVSFMEGQVGWHGKAPNEEQRQQALKELED